MMNDSTGDDMIMKEELDAPVRVTRELPPQEAAAASIIRGCVHAAGGVMPNERA
jgi:hypothetical protein